VPCVPFTGSVPLQAPEAVHEVALVEDHVNVDPLPLATLVGLALIDTVGEFVVVGEAVPTATVADWVVLPPVPVHVSIYLAVALRGAVDSVPFVGIVPLQAPDAEQEVAFVELHDNVAD
jgi:hypothetical protein